MALQQRPGARANHISATGNVSPPSRSSQTTTPIPAANRFDLLVNGQITVVKNAQVGLQQSLAFLQLASSKEEKESARIQVQSLLTRAEELILKLQVVMEIKNELAHTQKDLTEAKKAHQNTSHIRARIQWLDQRLEKLLLSHRRGGLAARGRRTLPMRPPAATAHNTEFRSQATRSSRFRRSTWFRSHGPTSSTLSPSKSITDSIETTSRLDTDLQSSAIQYSDLAPSIPVQDSTVPASNSWKMDSTDSSLYPPNSNSKSDSQSSCKQSVSRDSDSWHSESEANWTMVEASYNPMKDITQSQVLSSVDDEQKQSPNDHEHLSCSQQHSLSETPHTISPNLTLQHKETLSPFTEDEDEMPSRRTLEATASGLQEETQQHGWEEASMEESAYGFESPRPVNIFGPSSWNSLCLAVNKNLVTQSEPEKRRTAIGNIDLTISLLQAGVDSICRELDSLRQLVHTAARAATETGVTMPSTDKAHRHTSIYRKLPSVTVLGESMRFKPPLERNEGTSSGLVLKLPSLAANEVPSFDAPPLSRKVYGKKADPVYPRPSNTWHHGTASHTEGWRTDQPEACHSTLQDYGLRSSSRRRKSKSSRRCGRTSSMDKEDIFNSVGHHNRRIQHLLGQLNSPVAEIRKDSIQALGALSTTEDAQVVERLQLKLLQDYDSVVRCEAGKSLLHLGVLDSDVLQFVATHLAEGPPELQVYLLQLLQADRILNQLRKEWESPTHHELCLVFHGLLRSDNPDVSTLAAVLLSHIHVEEERCVSRLKAALKHSSPHYQSQALACLVQCWHHYSNDVIRHALDQMESLHNWQLRLTAIESLIVIGEHLLSCEVREENIFTVLLKRLVNEPVQAVRSALGRLLTKLNLNRKAETLLLARLESTNEMTRAEAITALAAFELRHQKIIQILVDCLELDPSMFVRVQVVRVLGQMKLYNMGVIRCLVEKSKGYGVVARESASALQHLSKQLNLQQEE